MDGLIGRPGLRISTLFTKLTYLAPHIRATQKINVSTPYLYQTNPKGGRQTRNRVIVQYGVIDKQINISTG